MLCLTAANCHLASPATKCQENSFTPVDQILYILTYDINIYRLLVQFCCKNRVLLHQCSSSIKFTAAQPEILHVADSQYGAGIPNSDGDFPVLLVKLEDTFDIEYCDYHPVTIMRCYDYFAHKFAIIS